MFDIGKPLLTGNDWFIPKPALEKSIEWQWGIFAIMTVLALATFVYAFRAWQKTGRSDAIWITVGSGIAAFYEPLGDFLAHVTYHEVNTIALTSAFGFTTPLWVLPCYVVFFGAPVLALLAFVEKGMTANKWLLFFFASIPGAWMFEVPLLKMGAIEYYGPNQPVHILDYPPWMAFSNSCAMFVTTVALYFVRRSPVIAQSPWLLAALFPMFVAGASAISILPVGSALSSSNSADVVNMLALVSMAVSVLYVWISGRVLESAQAQRSAPETAASQSALQTAAGR